MENGIIKTLIFRLCNWLKNVIIKHKRNVISI